MAELSRLDHIDDLDLLIEGDVVQIVIEHMPLWKYGVREWAGVYCSGEHWGGFLQFVAPAFMGEEYIIIHMARKDSIRVLDGKVVLNEDQSIAWSVRPQTSLRYSELNEILVNAGLRQSLV